MKQFTHRECVRVVVANGFYYNRQKGFESKYEVSSFWVRRLYSYLKKGFN